MNDASSELKVELRHIKALIDLLDKQAEEFLSEVDLGTDRWRVYFADADVIWTFIDGTLRSPFSEWSSVLSLVDGSSKQRRQASTEVSTLAKVTGQAVSRYLFGAFRKMAEIQRCRIFITPEHEREFKAIVHALLHRQARADSNWLEQLRDYYLELAKHNDNADTERSSARDIVNLLEKHAGGGAEDRAYTLLRDAITPLSSHLLTPPLAEYRPFLFTTSERNYLNTLSSSRRDVWKAFSDSLTARAQGAEELLLLKQVVFDADDDVGSSPRSFSFYRGRTMEWLNSRDAPPSLLIRSDLEVQIRMASHQAADLGAIARIDAFGKWLNSEKLPPNGTRWEPVLITGSNMLPSLLQHWPTQSEPTVVKLMHPLALLRRVDFWDPAGTRRLRDTDYLDQPHEFALSLIFRSTSGATSSAPENVEAFTSSLQSQLELVVAREAEVNDRGLSRLRRMLDASEEFNRKEYQEAVRDLVTQRFVQTYRHLTELFPGVSHQLPASSLPALDLPHSKAAMRFIANVRNTMAQSRALVLSADDLDASIKDDATGYSALLASAIGYMARGSTWLSAAQTMSATAVLLAKGRGETRYPEGNEALYLEAFLQRMTLTLTDDVEKFRHTHTEMVDEARKTLQRWSAQDPDVASEQVGSASAAPTRAAWIDYRYQLEANARDVFIVLCSVLRRQKNDLPWTRLAEISRSSIGLHQESVALLATVGSWDRQWMPSIRFCGIQLGMSLLQVWLCWRYVMGSDDRQGTFALHNYEEMLEPIVIEWHKHKDELGKLLPLLGAIFARDTGRASVWQQTRIYPSHFEVSFAAIDPQRFGWLRELWQTPGVLR